LSGVYRSTIDGVEIQMELKSDSTFKMTVASIGSKKETSGIYKIENDSIVLDSWIEAIDVVTGKRVPNPSLHMGKSLGVRNDWLIISEDSGLGLSKVHE